MVTKRRPVKPAVPDQRTTIKGLVEQARRRGGAVPIRKTFVQQGTQREPEPGPLARIVRKGDERALDLYLLMRLLAVAEPYDTKQPAYIWARALGLRGDSGTRMVSRIWTRLARLNLVKRARANDMAEITPLKEDASGEAYARPGRRGDFYLRLPIAYWTSSDSWYKKLDLPAKAMLLISLSLAPGFLLPSSQAKRWYGISPDTAQRGLAQLHRLDLLGYTENYKRAPLSRLGYTTERRYTLNAPFRVRRKVRKSDD